jgi:hypothetical protein
MRIDVLQLIRLYEGDPSLDVGIMTMNGRADKFPLARIIRAHARAVRVINNSTEEIDNAV